MSTLENNRIGIGKQPALLIVDVNNAFTDPDSGLGCEATDTIAAISQLLKMFRNVGLPIFFTTVAYSDPSQARVFREKLPILEILAMDSPMVKIDPRIAPRDGEAIIVKHWPSAFFKTDLADRMRARCVDSVIVTGLTTSGCVRASAVDALCNEFRVIVPREAVGDRDLSAHQANLHDIQCKYGDVLPLEETIAILRDASALGHSRSDAH